MSKRSPLDVELDTSIEELQAAVEQLEREREALTDALAEVRTVLDQLRALRGQSSCVTTPRH